MTAETDSMSDSKQRETLATIRGLHEPIPFDKGHCSVCNSSWPCQTRQAVDEALAVAASPEPSEPPPGPYRDQAGIFWYRTNDDEGRWREEACNSWLLWDVASELMSLPLVPLFSRDELIPDPDDEAAMWNLALDFGPAHSPRDIERVQAVCRVLRERAEARQTEGGSERG